MNWLKDAKALVASILALLAALIFVSGTITDLVRLPDRASRMEESLATIEARMDTLANAAQDLRLFLCVQMAEDEQDRFDCLQKWKTAEQGR